MRKYYDLIRGTLELLGDLGNAAVITIIIGEALKLWNLL